MNNKEIYSDHHLLVRKVRAFKKKFVMKNLNIPSRKVNEKHNLPIDGH